MLRRQDYTPTPYISKTVDLVFDIRASATRVTATTTFSVRDSSSGPLPSLELSLGPSTIVCLESISLDGSVLEASAYTVGGGKVVLPSSAGLRASFSLTVVTVVNAEGNTSLEGLYKSGSAYCTQCEAEGFRNITPFLDRPDVMPIWSCRIEADAASCPVLLSNGNLVESGRVAGDAMRHYALWADPFPKPSYLFALVAGDLARTESSFTTASGRDVALRIYTAARDADKTGWAMESLKRAMKWDEEKFGLEYECVRRRNARCLAG